MKCALFILIIGIITGCSTNTPIDPEKQKQFDRDMADLRLKIYVNSH